VCQRSVKFDHRILIVKTDVRIRIRKPINRYSFYIPSDDRAQNDNRPYHFGAKNEYIDSRFLAGGCGSRQKQVADGADVVFTDTHQSGSVLGCDY